MKKINMTRRAMATAMVLAAGTLHGSAQGEANPMNKASSLIQPFPMAVTCQKTTNLVFPYAIKSVDRGTGDILIQKASGAENVLQVKAAKAGFTETNMTVITADGSLYTYVLNYAKHPEALSIRMHHPRQTSVGTVLFDADATTSIIRKETEAVLTRQDKARGPRDGRYDITLQLKGIYTGDGVLYLQLGLQNTSAINYDIKALRFFIRDKKQPKRTASQELELQPLFILGNDHQVRREAEQTIAVALSQFTIPDQKYLAIQLMEENGGRNLILKISNRQLIRLGRTLP